MSRILVVDDEKNIRNALKEFLTGKGYEVRSAANKDVQHRVTSF